MWSVNFTSVIFTSSIFSAPVDCPATPAAVNSLAFALSLRAATAAKFALLMELSVGEE